MKKSLVFLLPLIALGTSTLTLAQAFLESTKFGMSSNEVSQVVPEAKPASGGNRLSSGARELLRIDEFVFADKAFEVSFFFKGDDLAQIMLSAKEPERKESGLRFFEAASAIFKGRYGAEKTRNISNRPGGLSAEAAWHSGQTEISLDISPVTQDTSRINISFRRIPAQDVNAAPTPAPPPAQAPVPLTAGLEGEFAPLGAFARVLNIVSFGYVGRADRRRQLFHSGQMSSAEISRKNTIDMILSGSGILLLVWVVRRVFRRNDSDN